jgi:methionyl-tRNA formyltransferase
LQAILERSGDEVICVVSQPDRPAGRKRIPTPCPLKAFAEGRNLKVLTPEKIGSDDSVRALEQLDPDLIVVVAYGQYIPRRVIELASHKAINVHPSLLPKYRGSAPIQWALLNGDHITGVSIIDVAQQMDAGDILRQEEFLIGDEDTSQTLHDKLAAFGADLLLKAIEDIRSGSVNRIPQEEGLAVEIRKLNKEDGEIDWCQSSYVIRNRIRAFDPWPGSSCRLPGGDVLKVWSAVAEEGAGTPGEVLDDRLLVATGKGALRLLEVQPAGKKRMPAESFLNGHPVDAGEILG